jgi:hypothetical protein
MAVYDTLKKAIQFKHCVRVFAAGRSRDICPHALGLKDGKARLLAFQYDGGSASGLAAGGQWRAFFLNEISVATPIKGHWQSGPNLLAKTEACLDRIELQARS